MGHKTRHPARYGGLAERVQVEMDRITCTWFPIRWRVSRGMFDVVEIHCQGVMVERDSQTPCPVNTVRSVAAASLLEMEPEDLHALGRSIVHDLVVHEIDEHLLVDGVRTWDPHAHTVWL